MNLPRRARPSWSHPVRAGRRARAAGALLLALAGCLAVLVGLPAGASAATTPALASGARLAPGASVSISSGGIVLAMTTAGALQLSAENQQLWTTGTTGPGNWAVMQGDGNLVVYTSTGRALWASNTAGRTGAAAYLRTAGSMQVIGADGSTLWSTGTVDSTLTSGHLLFAGQNLTSPSGRMQLLMTPSGALVLYDQGRPVWLVNSGQPGARLGLQTNGDLVLFSPTRGAVWDTGTFTGPSSLTLADDGTATLYQAASIAVWRVPGSNGGLPVVNAALAQQGLPYCYDGGNAYGPTAGRDTLCVKGKVGFDCSGLALYSVYRALGILLPHYSGDQYNLAARYGGVKVARTLLAPGDLVFFVGDGGSAAEPGHVGIYVGDNRMIDAQQDGVPVGVHTLYDGYVGAVRYWR